MASSFVVGDVVRLKSGGPGMTVVRINYAVDYVVQQSLGGLRVFCKKLVVDSLACHWFGTKGLYRECYKPDCLFKIDNKITESLGK